MPLTGSNKIDKKPLRAERWECADPVWWRPAKGEPLRRMTPSDIAAIHDEFAHHGRAHLLT